MRTLQLWTAIAATSIGHAQACTFTAAAWAGLTCNTMANQWRISLDDFIAWNPSVGPRCSNGLVPRTRYCVEGGVPSGPALPIPPPPVSPVQSGVDASCANFYYVESGNNCQTISQQFSISAGDFLRWNPAINSACTNMPAGVHVCVGVNVNGGFNDNWPGLDGVSQIQTFDLTPPNPFNPLRISGRVLGVNNYPESGWRTWLDQVECQSAGSPRRFDQNCATRAFVSAASSAIQYVANDPAMSYGVNAAGVRVVGPFYTRNNAFNGYVRDNGQGKSCFDCPGPREPRIVSSWKGPFLPSTDVYYLKTRRIKVTCKKACGAKDINVANLENILPLVPAKIRELRGGGANFFIWRDFNREIMARCRVTYAQGAWFNWVDGGVDLVYGGDELNACFRPN